jgi:hypothetical protein
MPEFDTKEAQELMQALKEAIEESVACEVPTHDEQPHLHAGEGEWYIVSGPCTHCGIPNTADLICDKFKRAVEASMAYGNVPCGSCKERNWVRDIVKGFTRRTS